MSTTTPPGLIIPMIRPGPELLELAMGDGQDHPRPLWIISLIVCPAHALRRSVPAASSPSSLPMPTRWKISVSSLIKAISRPPLRVLDHLGRP